MRQITFPVMTTDALAGMQIKYAQQSSIYWNSYGKTGPCNQAGIWKDAKIKMKS